MKHRNSTRLLPLFVACLFCFSCNNEKNNIVDFGTEETVAITSNELNEDYSAWMNLPGEYVDRFGVVVAEPVCSIYSWRENKESSMSVIILENRTTGQREGFFNRGNIYSLSALNELISALEDIGRQINTQTCRYKTTRQYITPHGILIHFAYDGNQWDEIVVQYDNRDEYDSSDEIEADYLSGYIDGLKSCVQFITEFKEKKWNNISGK